MINTSLIYNKKSVKLVNRKVYPKKNDVVIKVRSCGICGSDIKILNGNNKRVEAGRVIGHEISGQICNIVSKKLVTSNQNIILGADIPTVQILVFVFAIIFLFFNLLADILNAYLDPRLRL